MRVGWSTRMGRGWYRSIICNARPHGSSLDSDLETQLKSDTNRFTHLRTRYLVHTIGNEIQSSPWLIKPISGVMKMDKHREGIKSNRPCGENQNCSSVKITIKTHEQNYNNNTRWTRVLLTRSTRLRGVTRSTVLSMDVRESSSYMLREGDEITKSTTRLKLKKERQVINNNNIYSDN